MKPLILRALLAVWLGVVLGLALALAPRLGGRDQAAERPAAAAEGELLAEVMDRVRREYVDPVEQKILVDAAIRGIMAELDPHSALLGPSEYRDIRISTSGRYTGVGVEIGVDADQVVVVTPLEGGPAEAAGLQPGDVIFSIDGLGVGSDDLADTILRMRGVAGSQVVLGVRRPGSDDPFSVVLTRREIEFKSVHGRILESGAAYVRLSQFTDGTAADLVEVIEALRQQAGGPLPGLVLDLRNNPGGVLDAAMEVADAFLDQGLILSADGRAEEARFLVEASPGDLLSGAPLSVLVNRGSASGAEIVAGALQDNGRAVIVGETTFGKGSVQSIVPLSDGRAIKLTTSRYFTPSGRSIQGTGIQPDVRIAAPADGFGDPQLDVALDALRPQAVPAEGKRPVVAELKT
jgi:carboxyl-terminal processing protease